jgi:hypothetical protein
MPPNDLEADRALQHKHCHESALRLEVAVFGPSSRQTPGGACDIASVTRRSVLQLPDHPQERNAFLNARESHRSLPGAPDRTAFFKARQGKKYPVHSFAFAFQHPGALLKCGLNRQWKL